MASPPLVTVIILTFNRPQRLRMALRSVALQSYPHCEVIVVNDAGVAVEDVIADVQTGADLPITLINLATNRGIAAARNEGIARASGEFIALLDDDDRYRPDHLANLVAALQNTPAGVLAYDDILIQIEGEPRPDGNIRVIGTCRFGRPYDEKVFDTDDFIAPSAQVIRRSALARSGVFDETIPICEDWDLLLRLRQHGEFVYVPGAVGVDYSFRATPDDQVSINFGPERYAALALLSTRYNLPPLVPKTFLDVARDLGFAIIDEA